MGPHNTLRAVRGQNESLIKILSPKLEKQFFGLVLISKILSYQQEERIKLTQQLICNISDSYEEAKDLGINFNDYNEFIESKIKDCLYDRDSAFSQMVDSSIDRVQMSMND